LSVIPAIADRLKELHSVNDSDPMMGYRFLVTPRRKRSGTKAILKKAAAKKYKASGSSYKLAQKPGCKTSKSN
jgi:hypothetical protein